MTEPLASLFDLANYMGTDFDATDLHKEQLLETASAIIRSDAQEDFVLVEEDEISIDGMGTEYLVLPAFPVTEVTSVTEDDVLLVDGTDYRVQADAGLIRRLGIFWPRGQANIDIIYSHGYDTVPPDIAGVCLGLTARLLQDQTGRALTSAMEQLGAYQYTNTYAHQMNASLLLPTDSLIIAKYRRVLPR